MTFETAAAIRDFGIARLAAMPVALRVVAIVVLAAIAVVAIWAWMLCVAVVFIVDNWHNVLTLLALAFLLAPLFVLASVL